MDPRTLWSSPPRDLAMSRLTSLDPDMEEPASLTSLRSDSGLNSLECWDYTVELEAIQTQPGHQPASGEKYAKVQHLALI